jgi:hypothetical protein
LREFEELFGRAADGVAVEAWDVKTDIGTTSRLRRIATLLGRKGRRSSRSIPTGRQRLIGRRPR